MRDLNVDQLAACEAAPKWEHVTASMIFGSKSDYALSRRVFESNIQRYRELRLEWEYESGQRARPDEYFQA